MRYETEPLAKKRRRKEQNTFAEQPNNAKAHVKGTRFHVKQKEVEITTEPQKRRTDKANKQSDVRNYPDGKKEPTHLQASLGVKRGEKRRHRKVSQNKGVVTGIRPR